MKGDGHHAPSYLGFLAVHLKHADGRRRDGSAHVVGLPKRRGRRPVNLVACKEAEAFGLLETAELKCSADNAGLLSDATCRDERYVRFFTPPSP